MSKHRRNKRAKHLRESNSWNTETKSLCDLLVKEIQEATSSFIGTPVTSWNRERMIMEVQRAIGPHMHDIQYNYDTLASTLEVSGIVNTPKLETIQINLQLS